MEYEPYDSSGTDDDLPAQNQSMSARNPRIQIPNQQKNIHGLERDAYTAVLRAFKAQGDSITWDKENLITDLRRELRVSDEEHRELLTIVNSDDVSARPTGGPATSASRKRHIPSSAPPPIPLLSGSRSKKPKPDSSNLLGVNGVMENPTSLIGRKVRIRWPKDNIFYEAVIKEYDPHKGTHALVYYIGTAKEAWEWIDLKEIAQKDIRWDEDESGLTARKTSHGGPGPGRARSGGPGPGGPGMSKNGVPSQNGGAKKLLDNIQVPDTETIIKEVEKVLNNPDIFEIEKAKKLLKEHEQSLLDAIARLAEASDCESEEGNGDHHLGRNGRSLNY
ncbi:hypothetical protein LUZ60_003381 [Juncus effusus]|nr:hypothetical protein LUZ60_003381 [Juncus effusus]